MPPQSYGSVPIAAVGDILQVDVAVPLRPNEGFWLAFEAIDPPLAVRIGVESAGVMVDAATGTAWSSLLTENPQNYFVVPPQTEVDGIQVAPGVARPFVYLRQQEDGISLKLLMLAVPHVPHVAAAERDGLPSLQPLREESGRLDRGAQPDTPGLVPQVILADPYGMEAWDTRRSHGVVAAILAPATFSKITGKQSPPAIDENDGYKGWRLP